MNTVSDHMSNQFVDTHGTQKLFLPDASLSFNFKPDNNNPKPYNMSNVVNMPQFCMLMDSPQYGNANPTNMHQNMYSESVPILDLTQKSDEPFVLCKLPLHIYNRVVEMLHNKESMENQLQSPTPAPSVSTPIHASNTASSPLQLSTPFMTPQQQMQQQQQHTPLPPKHVQLQLTPATGMSTPPPTPNVSTPMKTPNSAIKDNEEYHIKGSWTEEEDKKLVDLVKKYGAKRWSFIASHLKGRIGKQCRERYLNHLDPKINKKAWTSHEDSIIVEMHSKHGNQWAKISRMLPGRTANAIKNHWNSTLSRRLEKLKRSPGDSNNDDDSIDDNESDNESFDNQHHELHHVMINPPPLPQPHSSGPFTGTSSSSTTRVLGGFNAIGGPITTTTPNGGAQIMDMPKFELFPTNNASFNAKKRLRLDEEPDDIHHDFDHHDDDLHHDLDDQHHMEDLGDEHANKRFKPHVLDLTQSHSDNKLKLESEERIFNPFGQQQPPPPSTSRTPLKSPSEQSNDANSAQKYKALTLNLDDGTNHDFDFSVICHNNYDCGLNLAEDNGPQGSQRRPSIVQGSQPPTPSNLNSTTPSNLALTPSSHIQEFFSDSLWSPKSVKNSTTTTSNVKNNKTFVSCS